MYIAASQMEREITIDKVDLESEIKIIITSIFDDLNLDVTTYKPNYKPTWVPNPDYTHSILQKLKNLHDNISNELKKHKNDTIKIAHEDDPLFSLMIYNTNDKFSVEAWSNICNDYMWDEKIEWIE